MRRTCLAIALCASTVGVGGVALATTDTAARELRGAIEESARSMRAVPVTGDVDRDFVRAMRQRHHDSIELARLQVKYGKDPSISDRIAMAHGRAFPTEMRC